MVLMQFKFYLTSFISKYSYFRNSVMDIANENWVPSSNFSRQVCNIHLHTNNLEKGMYPSPTPPCYGLNIRTHWALQPSLATRRPQKEMATYCMKNLLPSHMKGMIVKRASHTGLNWSDSINYFELTPINYTITWYW